MGESFIWLFNTMRRGYREDYPQIVKAKCFDTKWSKGTDTQDKFVDLNGRRYILVHETPPFMFRISSCGSRVCYVSVKMAGTRDTIESIVPDDTVGMFHESDDQSDAQWYRVLQVVVPHANRRATVFAVELDPI